MTRSAREQLKTTNGHGANAHRGRFLRGAATARPDSELVAAMERLLSLGDVQAVSAFTSVRGASLHHIETGQGRPLVLLHGASGGAANWFRLLRGLAQQRRVVALDLPGFGLSAAFPIDVPLGVNVAAIVAEWLSALRLDEYDLAATSFGSLVALRLAQSETARIGKIALINGVGFGRHLPLALRFATLSPISPLAVKPSRFGTRWQFNALMTADHRRLSAEVVSALLDYLWQSARAGDHHLMVQAITRFGSFGGQREILADDELRAIRQRLLIIWGERDKFLPVAHGERAAALVPHARLRIIPEAGHSPNWEAPEAVLECLSAFLESGSDQ